ncbi:hypothetical protein J4573_30275 [Actinomadura barringtoniae]|uniref:Uncharacterized protein n=1 Tax=Actinomadura barringtoniae TaxID=1427535 RepID=A0A939PMQ8_9ACTN|nr:hypothetical protein [Actinomadura barringtoniae]MBO2451411.1 hypothetical protein [Actinomadura barringtoniae]
MFRGVGEQSYEERVTVWRAGSLDEAIARAEGEAAEYAAAVGVEYLAFAQAYWIGGEEALGEGAEVFSLVRDSELGADAYLSRFFDTGAERQGEGG